MYNPKKPLLLSRRRVLPALQHPEIFAGPQNDRSLEEWQADAIIALNEGLSKL